MVRLPTRGRPTKIRTCRSPMLPANAAMGGGTVVGVGLIDVAVSRSSCDRAYSAWVGKMTGSDGQHSGVALYARAESCLIDDWGGDGWVRVGRGVYSHPTEAYLAVYAAAQCVSGGWGYLIPRAVLHGSVCDSLSDSLILDLFPVKGWAKLISREFGISVLRDEHQRPRGAGEERVGGCDRARAVSQSPRLADEMWGVHILEFSFSGAQ